MITNNPMQLKAVFKKRAAEAGVPAQLVMQHYFMERFIERLSLSTWRRCFIVKGGFLISTMVGIALRTTMDMDATVKGVPVHEEAVRSVFESICRIPLEDQVTFEVTGISGIRKGADYPGLRVAMRAAYGKMIVPLTMDVTTGDAITPKEQEMELPLLFDNRSIRLFAYNLETILSEKLESVLNRGVDNTRPRDFYDLHMLSRLRGKEIDFAVLRRALERTSAKRQSADRVFSQVEERLDAIRKSPALQRHWQKYGRENAYASGLSWEEVNDSIERLVKSVMAANITPAPKQWQRTPLVKS